jgi:uncharacterized protein (TIGR02145 family)
LQANGFCNSNTPGWGDSLGTVSFVSRQTWVVGSQTWSANVRASNCGKTTFDGGPVSNSFNADCRSSRRSNSGDFFSWCAVTRFADQLCPSPWRVPTSGDFTILVESLGGSSHITIHNRLGKQRGALGNGNANSSGVSRRGQAAFYWSQSELDAEHGFNFYADENEIVNPQSVQPKSLGLILRCVRDN